MAEFDSVSVVKLTVVWLVENFKNLFIDILKTINQ